MLQGGEEGGSELAGDETPTNATKSAVHPLLHFSQDFNSQITLILSSSRKG